MMNGDKWLRVVAGVERRAAWTRIRHILDTTPDEEVARIALSGNTALLEEWGITNELLEIALNADAEPEATERRLDQLFTFPDPRRKAIREHLERMEARA